jgi:hypothetical protein
MFGVDLFHVRRDAAKLAPRSQVRAARSPSERSRGTPWNIERHSAGSFDSAALRSG